MKRIVVSAVVCMSAVLTMLGATATAAPQPSNCWGTGSNDGQTAAFVQSSQGGAGPGLSGYPAGAIGNFVVGSQTAFCSMH